MHSDVTLLLPDTGREKDQCQPSRPWVRLTRPDNLLGQHCSRTQENRLSWNFQSSGGDRWQTKEPERDQIGEELILRVTEIRGPIGSLRAGFQANDMVQKVASPRWSRKSRVVSTGWTCCWDPELGCSRNERGSRWLWGSRQWGGREGPPWIEVTNLWPELGHFWKKRRCYW